MRSRRQREPLSPFSEALDNVVAWLISIIIIAKLPACVENEEGFDQLTIFSLRYSGATENELELSKVYTIFDNISLEQRIKKNKILLIFSNTKLTQAYKKATSIHVRYCHTSLDSTLRYYNKSTVH